MAGHSHAANVKHRKNAQGLKKAKLFTKLLRLVEVAVKKSGSDEDTNAALRLALEKARQVSLPKDKIKAAIDKASGIGGAVEDFEEVRYDGYASGGVGVIVEALTDNRNRTASDVRSTFTKFAGNLGESGSLNFSFNHIGAIYLRKDFDFDAVFEVAVELGADSVDKTDDYIEIVCSFENFIKVVTGIEKRFGTAEDSGLEFRPVNFIDITAAQKETLAKLVEALEDLDDVQNVWTNEE